jgi:transcriptional regulator with XRE-family HTH domain
MTALYESGKRRPTIENAARLADYLGVSLDYLCGLSEK